MHFFKTYLLQVVSKRLDFLTGTAFFIFVNLTPVGEQNEGQKSGIICRAMYSNRWMIEV
jgi:hypothetical protein